MAVQFNADADYLVLTGLSLSEVTVMAWVKFDTMGPGDYPCVFEIDDSGYGVGCYIENTWLDQLTAQNNDGYDTGTILVVDTWYHIAITFDSDGTLTVFLNGVQDSQEDDAARTIQAIAFADWYQTDGPGVEGMQGSMCYAKAWSQPLTADQIKNEMNTITPRTYEDLLAFWPMFPGDDTRRGKDWSGNGNHLTAAGTLGDTEATGTGVSWGTSGPLAAVAAALANYELALEGGSYAMSGAAAGLEYDRALALAGGSYAKTGAAVGLEYDRIMDLVGGSYAVTGADLDLVFGYSLELGGGAYVITGADLGFLLAYVLALGGGTYEMGDSGGDFQDGLVSFLSTWSGVHTAYPLNEDTNIGTDSGHTPNAISFDTAPGYPKQALDTKCEPQSSSDFDLYVVTDCCMLMYIPAGLTHLAEYGIFHNGGGTHAQSGFMRATETGVEIACTHNKSGTPQDNVIHEIPDASLPGWFALGFQFASAGGAQGDMALWIDGVKVRSGTRVNPLAYGSGNPDIGDSDADSPLEANCLDPSDYSGGDWGAELPITGTGILIANMVVDNPNNDNSHPQDGNGDTFHTDYYAEHAPSGGTQLLRSFNLPADAGVYEVTGADLDFIRDIVFSADGGSYEVTGADLEFLVDYNLNLESGTYIFTGAALGLLLNRLLDLEGGAYLWTGTAAVLQFGEGDIRVFFVDISAETRTHSVTIPPEIRAVFPDIDDETRIHTVETMPETRTHYPEVGGETREV